MTTLDAVLWSFLAEDILFALAELELPRPPPVPAFARPTWRPSKGRA